MATMSLGLFSSFISSEAAAFVKPSSLRFGAAPPRSPANLAVVRTVSTVTTATASKPAAAAGKREPRGIMKPRRVSPEMQELVGVPEIPRTQALKHIWAYIKEHNLQDPENKKIIVCDEKLKKIFSGKERVGFLEIAGLISPHFLK